jgi:hypothetical protein
LKNISQSNFSEHTLRVDSDPPFATELHAEAGKSYYLVEVESVLALVNWSRRELVRSGRWSGLQQTELHLAGTRRGRGMDQHRQRKLVPRKPQPRRLRPRSHGMAMKGTPRSSPTSMLTARIAPAMLAPLPVALSALALGPKNPISHSTAKPPPNTTAPAT